MRYMKSISRLFMILGGLFLLAACVGTDVEVVVSFDSNGGTLVESVTYDGVNEVTIPDNPLKEGYTFDGWFWDNDIFELPFMINSILDQPTQSDVDLTVYAKWIPVDFLITYELDGGINSDENPTTFNVESSVANFIDPIKEGYTFGGWYADEALTAAFDFEIMPAADITVYAKWLINKYEISYNILHVNQIGNISLDLGEVIIEVSLGNEHSSAITSIGRIFTWGNNSHGQLGDGTTTSKSTPTDITNHFDLELGEKIQSIFLSGKYSSAITSTGRIFTWGYNEYGQLGDGTTTNKSSPTEITNLFNLSAGEKILHISLGDNHSSAITSNGRIFTWGYNEYGQLGDGTTTSKSSPIDITNQFDLNVGEMIVQVSLGNRFSSVITSEGRLFTWGDNYSGQLGNGTTTESFFMANPIPHDITSMFNLGSDENIESIFLGFYHALGVTSSGRIFTWGYNSYGQLGDGTTTSKSTPTDITNQFNLGPDENIESISLGEFHSLAITSTGRIFTWGKHNNGQLFDGTPTGFITTPIEFTSQFTSSIGGTMKSISLGGYHFSALTSTGHIFMWGSNEGGQLGDGTTTTKLAPTQITTYSFMLVHQETNDYSSEITKYNPALEGYTFSGWYVDNDMTVPYVFTTMPAEDVILYGYRTAD